MQSVNNEGKDLLFHSVVLVCYHCCLGTLKKGWHFRSISKCSKCDSSCQSGVCSQDVQISILLLMISLLLKNPQVVPGKGKNLDMLLKKMSKGDIKAVTAGCILVVN